MIRVRRTLLLLAAMTLAVPAYAGEAEEAAPDDWFPGEFSGNVTLIVDLFDGVVGDFFGGHAPLLAVAIHDGAPPRQIREIAPAKRLASQPDRPGRGSE